ncbi:hypothetical protein V7S78_07565 [Aquirufa regiilacus]
MNSIVRNLAIIIFPFLTMILVNEYIRKNIAKSNYSIHGVNTINSAKYIPTQCSWACHNNTAYCKKEHVKYLKGYYKLTDIFYFGMISALKSMGNYALANIFILVFLIPCSFLYFWIKSLEIQDKINKLTI